MAYDVALKLPAAWTVESEVFNDDMGVEVTRVSASSDRDFIDIYVGPLPEGETAEDQAFANYAESVGFYEDDPEDFNPIESFQFNNKKAFGFEGLSEENLPLRIFTQELRKGILGVFVVIGHNEKALADNMALLERSFRLTV